MGGGGGGVASLGWGVEVFGRISWILVWAWLVWRGDVIVEDREGEYWKEERRMVRGSAADKIPRLHRACLGFSNLLRSSVHPPRGLDDAMRYELIFCSLH